MTALAFIFLIGGLVVVEAFDSSEGDNVAVAGAVTDAGQDADGGAEVFASNCASCHGAEGEGGVGPGFEGVVDRLPDAAERRATVAEFGSGSPPGARTRGGARCRPSDPR